MLTTVPVSVIIPCYRCSETISRALRSVYLQTYRPFEVILVDDCSGDGTLDELLSLQDRYGHDWVRVVNLQINSGAASARNAGWGCARGQYIAFLDSDDAWHPKKVEIQYNLMNRDYSVDLIGHDRIRIAEVPEQESGGLVGSVDGAVSQVSALRLRFSNCFPTSSVMIRKNSDFRFAEGKRFSEDYDLWLRLAHSGYLCWYISLPLAYCFKHQYGAGGLSSEHANMIKGELENYLDLYRANQIGGFGLFCVLAYALLKFPRRLVVSFCSRGR